jgi:hypothetical protein
VSGARTASKRTTRGPGDPRRTPPGASWEAVSEQRGPREAPGASEPLPEGSASAIDGKAASATTARRPRRGLKRTHFQVPGKMPLPLRALWNLASEEERARAHRTATAILSTWLGKTRREEAAKELGLSAVRLWQLSQQAVCGLVVGCLRQPRFRGRPSPEGGGLFGEGVGVLRKRIEDLERELDASRRLVDVMKDLPGNRARAEEREARDGRIRRHRAGAAGTTDRVAATAVGTAADGGPRT